MIDLPRFTIFYLLNKLLAKPNFWTVRLSGKFKSFHKMEAMKKGAGSRFTVAIEGNIGSGKTTVLQHFMRYPSAMVLPEPVSSWRNVNGHNLLNLMYVDPLKWSFTFQSYVQLTMAQQHLLKHGYSNNVKLMERSIFSARYCFVENLYQSKKLAEPDYLVLSKWFEFLTCDDNLPLDLIVYLKTFPEIVYNRILQRGREEEKGITLEYLKTLHNLHEDWLIKHKFKVPCPVLVFDANCDLDDLECLCQKHADEILFSSSQDLFPYNATIHR